MFFTRKKPKKDDPNSRRARFACIKNQVKKREIIEIIVLKILILIILVLDLQKKLFWYLNFLYAASLQKGEKIKEQKQRVQYRENQRKLEKFIKIL